MDNKVTLYAVCYMNGTLDALHEVARTIHTSLESASACARRGVAGVDGYLAAHVFTVEPDGRTGFSGTEVRELMASFNRADRQAWLNALASRALPCSTTIHSVDVTIVAKEGV